MLTLYDRRQKSYDYSTLLRWRTFCSWSVYILPPAQCILKLINMGSLFSFLYRVYAVLYPPSPPKTPDALRYGILGTAWMGYYLHLPSKEYKLILKFRSSFTIVLPSISHPEVVIAAQVGISHERKPMRRSTKSL